MRLASFGMALEGGGQGDCSIVVLGGDGGGLEPNVNRWRGQIGLPPLTGDELEQSVRWLEGKLGRLDYLRLVNPDSPETAFLVAVASLPEATAYIKLIAPADQLDLLETDFVALCTSLGVDS